MNIKYTINADVGEAIGDDQSLMPLIQACNIACGAHAGSPEEMQKTIQLAQTYQVRIGAHPSYPDREYFGRRSLKLTPKELQKSIENQLIALLRELNSNKLHHIKPHGALYHDSSRDRKVAKTLIAAAKSLCPSVVFITAPGSLFGKIAENKGFEILEETFLDRAYQDDGLLVPRNQQGAILQSTAQLNERFYNLVVHQRIKTISNQWISVKSDTICVHGDHPNASQNLKFVLEKFQESNTSIHDA